MRAAAQLPIALLVGLAGCSKFDAAGTDAGDGGRYGGIGTYAADGLWKHLKGAPEPKDADAARLKDDSQIIVVVDRQTGEVRQCGNNSGYCVAMNPWKGAAPAQPAKLNAHADEIDKAVNEAVNASH